MTTIPVPATREQMHALANVHGKLSAVYAKWKNAYGYRYGAHPIARAALEQMVETETVLDSAFHQHCIRALFRHGAGRACVTVEYSWKKPTFDFLGTLNRAIGMGAFTESDFDRVQAFLENRTGGSYTWTADGKIEDNDEVQYCDLSGEYYSSGANMISFITSRGRGGHRNWPRELGIEREVNRQCFYCERSSEWYLSDDFREIECEGDTLCLEANEDEVFYWASDGEYHYDTEPEDEDEDEDNNGRASYHSTRPAWWSNPHAHHRISGTVPLFGMELEINCRDMGDFCSALRNTGLLTECDASLDSIKGVEIIGGPYSLEQYQRSQTAWEAFYPRVSLDECVGHEAHKDCKPYGIHISISRSAFANDYHLSRFVVFFNVAEQLCKNVAQRDVIYSGGYKIRTKPGKSALRTTKYETVNVTDSRAEVRIFRSNCRKDRHIKNIEFCHAVFEFVRMASLASLSDESLASSEFLAWLALPANVKTYPHLVDFLGNFNYKYKFFSERLAKKRKGNTDKK